MYWLIYTLFCWVLLEEYLVLFLLRFLPSVIPLHSQTWFLFLSNVIPNFMMIHPNYYTDIYSQQNCFTGVPLATYTHSRNCILLCISWISSLLPFVFLCHFISISKFHSYIKMMIKYFTWRLLHAGFMLGLLLHSDDEGKMFLQNITWVSINYMVLYPKF